VTQKPQRFDRMKYDSRLTSMIDFRHGENNGKSQAMTRPGEGIASGVMVGFVALERYYRVATSRMKVCRSHLVIRSVVR
jgi:hypothetical protein